MKTLISICIVLFLSCSFVYSQESISEPDFIGEAILLSADNSVKALEKTTVQFKTKAAASMYIVGIGKVKTRITIDGCCAAVRANENEDFKLIIKAVDNDTDPLSIISIFKMEQKKKDRRAELSSLSTFGGTSDNNLDLLSYSAKKYGTSSYLITLNEKPVGEYGIIVRNPNSLDEKTTVVATFAIEE